jgi:replicative DNA helicase
MFDDEIEKAVLFYLIFDDKDADLTEADFLNPAHKKIINAINVLKMRKEERTILTVRNAIDENSSQALEYLANLGNYISNTSFETAYKLLKKYTKKRQVVDLARKILIEINENEDPDVFIETQISSLQKIEYQTETDNNFVQQVADTVGEIEKNINVKKNYDLYTGIYDLDDLTDGLHNGELTIIGARPRCW